MENHPSQTINQIKNLISNGEIETAFKIASKYYQNLDHQKYDKVILLSSQYSELKQKELLGTGSDSEAKNRIIQGFLKILDIEEQNSATSKKRNHWAYITVIGLILLFAFGINFFNTEPIQFTFHDNNNLRFRSDGLLKIEQKSGKKLKEIYLSIDDQSKFITTLDSCQCWMVNLDDYGFENGNYNISIKENSTAQKSLIEIPLRIDDLSIDGKVDINSYRFGENADSIIAVYSGRANKKVKIEVSMPFVIDSSNVRITYDEDQNGVYFNVQLKIPVNKIEEFNNNSYSFSIVDETGNRVGFKPKINSLLSGYIPPFYYGEYILGIESWYKNPDKLMIPDRITITDKNDYTNHSKHIDPDLVKNTKDSLNFFIKFYTPRITHLEWEFNNSITKKSNKFIVTRKVIKSVIKDDSLDYSLKHFETNSTELVDSIIKMGHQYEYRVDAFDEDGKLISKSHTVRHVVPLQPIIAQIPFQKNQGFLDSAFYSRLKIDSVFNISSKNRNSVFNTSSENITDFLSNIISKIDITFGVTFKMAKFSLSDVGEAEDEEKYREVKNLFLNKIIECIKGRKILYKPGLRVTPSQTPFSKTSMVSGVEFSLIKYRNNYFLKAKLFDGPPEPYEFVDDPSNEIIDSNLFSKNQLTEFECSNLAPQTWRIIRD